MTLRVALAVLALAWGTGCSPVVDRAEVAGRATAPVDGRCSDDEVAAMDAVVDAQLAAFAADDWAAGLALATEAVQAGTDARRLEEIVTRDYPAAADARGHVVVACVVADAAGQLLVGLEVDGGTTSELLYLLEREEAGWRIAGALPHGAAPSGAEPAITA